MAEITFVNVESETVAVKEECAEEEDPLSVTLSTKGKKFINLIKTLQISFFSTFFLICSYSLFLIPCIRGTSDCDHS